MTELADELRIHSEPKMEEDPDWYLFQLTPPTLPGNGINLNQVLNHVERNLINQALARTDGNRAQAARLLGLNRTTLVMKLKKHYTEVKDERVL